MPPKTFRDGRADAFMTVAAEHIPEGRLVRFNGVAPEYKYPTVVLADADWVGPVFIAQNERRPGSKLFVRRYGYVLNAEVVGLDSHTLGDTVVYLADQGRLSVDGLRPVGSLAEHPDKGPIALIEANACGGVNLGVFDFLFDKIAQLERRLPEEEVPEEEVPEEEVPEGVEVDDLPVVESEPPPEPKPAAKRKSRKKSGSDA